MRIISIRKGFQCDHSSSSYEFFSSERALTDEERRKVARYSSRSRPGTRKATFHYDGDWNDLPSKAEDDLLINYFDILVSESYDWWHFAITFSHNERLLKKLKKYECEGADDTGVRIDQMKDRIIWHLFCQIDYDESPWNFARIGEEEEDESLVDVDFRRFRNLLIALKREILQGNFSSLQAIMDFYEPGKLGDEIPYTRVGKKFCSILVKI
ncbi:MAG: hypothetical protein ACTSQI_14220 [Candidatus Helarchaeota archaeon]